MNIASVKSYMKQNGQNLMSVSGIFCLILSIWLIMSFNNKHELRYTELLQNLTAEEKGIVPVNLDILAGLEESLTVNERLKRSTNESVEEQDTESVEENDNEGDERNETESVEGNNSERIDGKVTKKRKGSRRRSNVGTVYVRWGRKSCPGASTELVYSGIAAGSWHAHQGGATNIQCLPKIPGWGNYTDKVGGAFLYGVEYNEAFTNVVEMTNAKGKTLLNQNVPCAVCHSKKRTSSIMVPAAIKCFRGWHLEYTGYIMAGHHGSASGTSYLCVDDEPEVGIAGYRNEDGALLYRVTGECGTLPCPKYVKHRELSCAVCTK